MAKKKKKKENKTERVKVVKAKVTKHEVRSRKTKRFHSFEVWAWSRGPGGKPFGMGYQEQANTLKKAKQWADQHDLIAPVIIEIDISPIPY